MSYCRPSCNPDGLYIYQGINGINVIKDKIDVVIEPKYFHGLIKNYLLYLFDNFYYDKFYEDIYDYYDKKYQMELDLIYTFGNIRLVIGDKIGSFSRVCILEKYPDKKVPSYEDIFSRKDELKIEVIEFSHLTWSYMVGSNAHRFLPRNTLIRRIMRIFM